MLHHFAETVSYTTTSNSPLSGSALVALVLFALAVAVLMIASMWRIFQKAGKPGWAAIVPLYNTWVLAEVCGKPGWWGLYPLIGVIPFLGAFVSLILSVYFSILLAKVFGRGVGFAILALLIFPFVGYPMLGFGDAKYLGPEAGAAAGPVPPASNGSDQQDPAPQTPVTNPEPPVDQNPPQQPPTNTAQ